VPAEGRHPFFFFFLLGNGRVVTHTATSSSTGPTTIKKKKIPVANNISGTGALQASFWPTPFT